MRVVSAPGTTLQVPEEFAEQAMALIERNQKVAEQQDPEGSSEELRAAVAPEARLGRAVRWLTLLFVTAPLALVLGVVSLGVAGFLFYLTLISDIATPVIFQFYCLGLLVWRYIFLHIPCALLLHRLLHPDPAFLTLHLFPHEGLLGRH